jgi:hypothetical protein
VDPDGRIYESENVPPEDRARLDGYLRARAEQDALAAAEERLAELEAQARAGSPDSGLEASKPKQPAEHPAVQRRTR